MRKADEIRREIKEVEKRIKEIVDKGMRSEAKDEHFYKGRLEELYRELSACPECEDTGF